MPVGVPLAGPTAVKVAVKVTLGNGSCRIGSGRNDVGGTGFCDGERSVVTEFLERRFSPASRYVLSVVSIITFIVSKIAVGIFAGGVVFGTLLPELHLQIGGMRIDSFWIGSVLVIVLTGLYTALGGMRAVAYNDAVQTVVLITGSACLTFYGLAKLGGWGELRHFCGSDMFNLWKPLIPAGVHGTWSPVIESNAAGHVVKQAWYFNGNFPWLGMLFCAPIIGLWYWCTDQYIVQRALGAPNETVARRGSIFAAFLKLSPVYLFIVPGLICFALPRAGKFLNWPASLGPTATPFRRLRKGLSPAGRVSSPARASRHRGRRPAFGLDGFACRGVQRLFDSIYRGSCTESGRPRRRQHQIVRTGRLATAIMVLVALAWIPVIKNAHGLYDYLQAVQGYLAPPIFVVFFFGVFFKRLNAARALWAMLVGFALGIFRMPVDTPVTLGASRISRRISLTARFSGSSTISIFNTSAC